MITNATLLLHVVSNLFANLFFYLLKSLEEELFDLAPLVNDNLGKGAHIPQLPIFHSQVLFGVEDLFALLFDYLVMLVSDKLLFFLKVNIKFRLREMLDCI